MKRILFLGQRPIARRCFDLLLERAGSLGLVVEAVAADREFFGALDAAGAVPACVRIPNEARNEEALLAAIRSRGVDALISVQHPWVVSAAVLEAVGGRAFNLHNAKLPEYRGYNTISHAILNGDPVYTTTVHWMAPEVDTGDLAYEASVPVGDCDTAWSLYQKTMGSADAVFGRLICDLGGGKTVPRRPPGPGGRFYRKREIEALKEIVSPGDAREVDRKARAFYFPPHEPAYFKIGGKKFYVSVVPY